MARILIAEEAAYIRNVPARWMSRQARRVQGGLGTRFAQVARFPERPPTAPPDQPAARTGRLGAGRRARTRRHEEDAS
jgi:hypothetical protein